MPSTTQVIVEGAPWWSGGVFALVGAIVGGLGTYLAQRRQDRRARRAAIVTTFGNRLETAMRLVPHDPNTAVEMLWPLGHDVWREALTISSNDARKARRILDSSVALRKAIEADRSRPEAQSTYNEYEYDGTSLAPQTAAVSEAIIVYLQHLMRSLGTISRRDSTSVLSPRT